MSPTAASPSWTSGSAASARAREPLTLNRSGRYAVESYLDHHADKLIHRFDAGTYVALTDAMNTHDVGRGRGGVAAALRTIQSPLVVAGIDTDRLYPLRLQAEIAELAPGCEGLDVVVSAYGHDGFLIEVDAVAGLVTRTLARACESRWSGSGRSSTAVLPQS